MMVARLVKETACVIFLLKYFQSDPLTGDKLFLFLYYNVDHIFHHVPLPVGLKLLT